MANPEHRSVFDSFEDTALLEGLEEVKTLVSPPVVAETCSFERAETHLIVEDVSYRNTRHASPHGEVSDKMFCSTCQCPFESREEQMEHYKLDWHRFNLRQRLAGHTPLTVEDFERKTGAGDVSSISGSDSEEEASDTDSGIHGDGTSTLEKVESCPEVEAVQGRLASRVLFRNSRGQYLSVFRCVLLSRKSDSKEGDLVPSLMSIGSKSMWVVLMTGGGHFAGAVFQGKEVLQHKTFHRYTVRAKRGTAQGLRDSQNRSHTPKSAGAALRRYNEAALVKDVQDLLESWLEYLREASAIFVRAPTYNRAMFFGGRQPPLSKSDPRVRTLPFPTRRATFREVLRVHESLATLHVYGEETKVLSIFSPQKKVWKEKVRRSLPQTGCERDVTITAPPVADEENSSGEEALELETVEEALGTLDLRESELLPRRRRRRKRKEGVRALLLESVGGKCEERAVEEEEAADSREGRERKAQNGKPRKSRKTLSTEKGPKDVLQESRVYGLRDALFTACKVGDLAALHSLLQPPAEDGREGESQSPAALINEAIDPSGFTLLHVASAAGQRGVVRMLMDAGGDPAVRDKKGRTPYSVAPEKDTRNEFRAYMAECPDKYDYSRAQVPGPLTADIEAKKAERKRAQKATRKQREKELKEERRREEEEREEKRRFAELSDREKRALAAERRLEQQVALTGGALSNTRRCWQCGESLLGKVPFQYLDFSFCTTRCVQEHRKARASNPKN